MKRFFDVLVAVVALAILWPVLVIVAGAVRFTLGPPVFFRQERPGLHGLPFELLKFRTMRHVCEENVCNLSDEARLTRFGELLRRTSLDELPQLVNVLRGEMSLVGPRPLLMDYLPLYSSRQARRHEVRPGITGWAQVNGRNAISWEQKFEHDVWYVDNQSFWLDMRILFLTFAHLFKRKDISHAGHATMPRFTGSGHDD